MTAAAVAIRLPFFDRRTLRGNEPVSSPGRDAVSIEKRFGSIARQVYVRDLRMPTEGHLAFVYGEEPYSEWIVGDGESEGKKLTSSSRWPVTHPETLESRCNRETVRFFELGFHV